MPTSYSGSYYIPNGITIIAGGAFRYCEGLTDVKIPNSVTSIGNEAFYCCYGLTSMTIPNAVTSIGDGAFSYCSGLSSMTIPNSVTSMGEMAFRGCKRLTNVSIPNSVTSIGKAAFESCSGLSSMTIPNSVTYIGEDAFANCSGLTSIEIPNSVTSIGSYAFHECKGLTGVSISDLDKWAEIEFGDYYANPLYYARKLYLNGQLVTDAKLATTKKIGSYAFCKYSGLDNVTIPNSVTSIGDYAFSDCRGLGNVIIPNSVTSIGGGAFAGCDQVLSVTIGNSVTSIGGGAFALCTDVQELVYAEGTKVVLATSLSSITSVSIPNSVTSIEDAAFYKCSNLKSVTIPNSVTSIGNSAFSWCSGLTSVAIPNSVTSIGNCAFKECYNLTAIFVEWKDAEKIPSLSSEDFPYSTCSLMMPLGTGSIYKSKSFWNTFQDIYEYVPESVLFFGSCGKNVKWSFDSRTGHLSITGSGKMMDYSSDSYAPWIKYKDIIKSLYIGNRITSIGDYAFCYCSDLARVTIGKSVTSIGSYAFCGCKDLISVTIPISVTSIGEKAFFCSSGWGKNVYIGWNDADKIPNLSSEDFHYKSCNLFVPTETKPIYQSKDYWGDFKMINEYDLEPESVLLGDADDDGSVNVSDITTIATFILNGKVASWNIKNADANEDGAINVSDITTTASIILGREDDDDDVDPHAYLKCPDNNHPHAIDLGLPSGTKWCCCNVGATTPEGYGGYYAWGETSEKSYYSVDSYAYWQDKNDNGYVEEEYADIGSDIAGTQYDVAHVIMGGSWQMPTYDQQIELMHSCATTSIKRNGLEGILLTGINGGQIFIPAAGYRMGYGVIDAEHGYYWSSSLYPYYYNRCRAYEIYLGIPAYLESDECDRYFGQSVRAVCQ